MALYRKELLRVREVIILSRYETAKTKLWSPDFRLSPNVVSCNQKNATTLGRDPVSIPNKDEIDITTELFSANSMLVSQWYISIDYLPGASRIKIEMKTLTVANIINSRTTTSAYCCHDQWPCQTKEFGFYCRSHDEPGASVALLVNLKKKRGFPVLRCGVNWRRLQFLSIIFRTIALTPFRWPSMLVEYTFQA